MRWTKGFNCSGVVGENVVELLSKAIAERGDVKIEVMAVLNDTTGTLMSCAWTDPETYVGLIVGTGSNACYFEDVKRAELFQGEPTDTHVIINCEWGAFGENGIVNIFRTKHDEAVDSQSLHPGKQIFEKMIAGMYLGEIVRLILMELIEHGLFLDKVNGGYGKIEQPNSFEAKLVSMAEEDDETEEYYNCKRVFTALGKY